MDNTIVMEYTKLLEKKARLQKELSVLPQGYISKKNINGKTYHYLQNRVSGKMAGIYLKKDKVDRVSEQIRLRKQYEAVSYTHLQSCKSINLLLWHGKRCCAP